jgi:glutamate/tyrosine decarboxylase-like PLP-dependent enzyme
MDPDAKLSDINTLLQSFFEKPQCLSLHRRELPVLPKDDAIIQARHLLLECLPEEGTPDWTEHLIEHIAPALNANSLSPRYYGFVTGGCTPAALIGDMLASVYDQNVQVHLPDQTIATNVEAATLNMLLDLFRLDRDVWGASPTFTTGATASNVLGLAMGREWVLRRRMEKNGSPMMSVGEHGIYEVMKAAGVKNLQIVSTMPHSSIAKAASILGIGRAHVVSVSRASGSGVSPIEIDFGLLEEETKRPNVATILAISAGEVNTGRFASNGLGQMKKLRAVCDQHDIWIHVDGAFGLFGRILGAPTDVTEFGEILQGCQGLELADSITGDGHKLLNVPYDCGFYFCRHKGIAEEVFRNGNAAYLTSAASDDTISSPLNIGIENSRRFRALPVYTSLMAYGRNGYTDMLRRQIRLARKVVADLWDSEAYQVLPEARGRTEIVGKTFMIVLFRAKNDHLNEDLVRRINATRKMYVSGTRWEGRPAARIAIANWAVDVERDYHVILDVLQDVAK